MIEVYSIVSWIGNQVVISLVTILVALRLAPAGIHALEGPYLAEPRRTTKRVIDTYVTFPIMSKGRETGAGFDVGSGAGWRRMQSAPCV